MKSLMLAIFYGFMECWTRSYISLWKLFIHEGVRYPSCDFYYYLTLCLVAVIASTLYCVIARRYKYRVRQEIYHGQYVVENIFEREFNARDEEEGTDTEESYSEYPADETGENNDRKAETDFYWNFLPSGNS